MKTNNEYLEELKEIRLMMEQSSRFLSLSGLSGILMGIYALAGAFVAYRLINFPPPPGYREHLANDIILPLALVAIITLVLSLLTVTILTYYKTKKAGYKAWSKGARMMVVNLAIPLVSGGIFILIMAFRGVYEVISPSFLIFYGLALVNAAKFTHREIFYMGICQIIIGIVAAIYPGYGLILWATGFGAMHIVYGTVMHFRYDANKREISK